MHALDILLLAMGVCIVTHVLVMAAVGALSGLRVLQIAFGLGPQWLKLGRLRLGIIPVGGYTVFATPIEEVLSVPAQLALTLSGVAALLIMSIALLGVASLGAFVDGFGQWLAGASSPLAAAQSLIAAACRQALQGTFVATLGLTAAKMAMVNVTPWPGTNGGQALAILGQRLGLARRWPESGTNVLRTLCFAAFVSWVVALVVFVVRH
jgi:hypothetical protein